MNPRSIEVRGARVHNLRDVDVDIPLGTFVGITGVSGSGKSSLALGVLYAEGSRRYLDGLSTYQRRRIGQAARPQVRSIKYIPAALALPQRPPLPGPRSTVASMTELGAVLRLSMSRLGAHPCPQGHLVQTTTAAWVTERLTCPIDGTEFPLPSAESFSPATLGACPRCGGLGTVTDVDETALVPNPDLTLDQGAVASWRATGRRHMPIVVRELGVRTDVPFRDLTDQEQDIVLHGPPVKKHVLITSKAGRAFPLDAKYENAVDSARTLGHSRRSRGTATSARRFLTARTCPECHGSGLGPAARASRLLGRSLPELLDMPLSEIPAFAEELRATGPSALTLADELAKAATAPLTLGLGYLTVGRRGDTLSTGERQRIELAGTAMRQTTGMLYVLDEPTVGLHPSAVAGLIDTMHGIVGDGNTLVVVDHDVAVLRASTDLIEIGPGAGENGGRIIAHGTPDAVAADPDSVIAPCLRGEGADPVRDLLPVTEDQPAITITVGDLHTLHDVTARFPRERLTVVAGVSGAGKSALVIEALAAALTAREQHAPLPPSVTALDSGSLTRVVVSDATPIGANARSTPATYSGVFDKMRAQFAATPLARERGWNAGWFSYNTGGGRCPTCDGLGSLSLDLQYLPDLEIDCPTCEGRRYTDPTLEVTVAGRSIADVLALTVSDAIGSWDGPAGAKRTLRSLADVGLGYLTLGEPTPSLSGGESQRLRLATELSRGHDGEVFIFDEPTIGLHPRDVRTLIGTLDRLVHHGATVIVIDHDLDLLANADHVIEMGPGGGDDGGRIVFAGSPRELAALAGTPASTPTAPWLAAHLAGRG
ncbi:excinuclease ABC subunit UvrA [Microbacterium gorillae]|uniref:AAA family ATPase n=1 Tax=Microbacterium gorillae TaxID=1231063 RepID=UPI00058B02DB|nr:AAA family ATPase [Microbacterium gorillae]